MKYETLDQAVAAVKQLQQTMAAYNHAMGVLYHDGSTAAPKDSWQGRGKTMEVLSKVVYDLTANPENKELFDFLLESSGELDTQTLREVEVLNL